MTEAEASEELATVTRTRPWTVKAYAAIFLIQAVMWPISQLLTSDSGWLSVILSAVLVDGLVFLLFVRPIWRGSRVAWVIVFVFTVAGAVMYFREPAMYGGFFTGAVTALYAALLLHPQTQRWCRVRLW
ncbi:MAG: hypothetical protein ACR2KQ_04170 [Actinomycetota bacterium]